MKKYSLYVKQLTIMKRDLTTQQEETTIIKESIRDPQMIKPGNFKNVSNGFYWVIAAIQ